RGLASACPHPSQPFARATKPRANARAISASWARPSCATALRSPNLSDMKNREVMKNCILGIGAILAAGLGSIETARSADSYPARPIRLVVPYPAGGPADTLARFVAPGLASRLGGNVVVDNRGGAGG